MVDVVNCSADDQCRHRLDTRPLGLCNAGLLFAEVNDLNFEAPGVQSLGDESLGTHAHGASGMEELGFGHNDLQNHEHLDTLITGTSGNTRHDYTQTSRDKRETKSAKGTKRYKF